MFVCHSCCLNWEARGFDVVVLFVNIIAIWAHSMHHTYIWCKSTFYPHCYVIPRVAVIHVIVCDREVCMCLCVNVRLGECGHLSLMWVWIWAPRVAYVLPINDNIFTVDMSAFFQSSGLIYIFSRQTWVFFLHCNIMKHMYGPHICRYEPWSNQ